MTDQQEYTDTYTPSVTPEKRSKVEDLTQLQKTRKGVMEVGGLEGYFYAKERVAEYEYNAAQHLLCIQSMVGSTFTCEGQLYQIRTRMNKSLGKKMPYLCKLKRRPAEWLAEAREKRLMEKVNAVSAQPNTSIPHIPPLPEMPQDETPQDNPAPPGVIILE